jgi:NAD(P)-dependent dehydrogenase (short-subunit alcohol dehydrogenase family)
VTARAVAGGTPAALDAFRLDGKVALVTGAGRGIGRACALALADAGADVALVARSEHELTAVASEVSARGRRAWPAVCDVTRAADLAAVVGGLDRVDILVTSAGMNIPEPFLDVSEERLDRVLDLNVKGAFLSAQAVARAMVAAGVEGSIVHLSSQMGHVGAPNRTVYCATKHAIEGLTKAMAVELAPSRIRVNAVAPTYVVTAMTRSFLEDPTFREDALRRIPLGRVAEVEDIVGAVLYLASPAARLVTGTSLVVDGGYTAQ